MESNNIFNIKRFGKYLVSDLTRCAANFGISFLVITLAGVLCYLISGVASMATGSGWYSANALLRALFMGISALMLIINMPAKCYGFITDRKAGANWLMLPVSTTEKFVSMLIITLVIIPAAFLAGALVLDCLIVAVDPNLDTTIIAGIKEIFNIVAFEATEESGMSAFITDNIVSGKIFISGIDDVATMTLIFLLGALYFKRNKAAKTILTWIAVASVISIVTLPLISVMMPGIDMETINAVDSGDIEAATLVAESFFDKAMTFDVILDTIIMLGAATGIFFRIKTLKH